MCIFLCVRDMVFTFMHLADAFIQSDLQCIQSIHFFCHFFVVCNKLFLLFSILKSVISIFCKHNWYNFVVYVFSIL